MAVIAPASERDPQHTYARWLELGTRIVFAFGVLALALYLSGLVAPLIPLRDLPSLWTLPAAELLREAHAPSGWAWLRYLRYGDYLNVAAIAAFSLLSLVCLARVIRAFLRCGERVQALLAALQVLVLLAAALGAFPGAS
ncbi:MAG TPA: hypothetical protein VFJ70_16645 [Burkholderiales bacterium]|nr:hypothetical protein [Burkholderiales bacterium]